MFKGMFSPCSKSSLLIRKQSEVIRNKGVVFKIVVDSVVLYSYMCKTDKIRGGEMRGRERES